MSALTKVLESGVDPNLANQVQSTQYVFSYSHTHDSPVYTES